MTNPESIVARLDNELGQSVKRDMTVDTHNQLTEVRVKVRSNMERLKTKRQAIQDNRSLSIEGQRAAIATLANDAIGDYVSVGRIVERLETELADTTLFSVKPRITDAVVRQMRNAEQRNDVRGLSQNERDVEFLGAAEQDNDELLDAMLDAPGRPMVSPDMKRRALDARARRLNPKGYAQWEQTVLLRDHVKALLEHVALALVSMGADATKVAKELGIVLHDVIEEQQRAAKTSGEVGKLVGSTT